jgi:glycosyltransferase involved in cell wall biosynthesis
MRILDAYGVSGVVVHPPVDTSFFTPPDEPINEGYAIVAGRLVAYKRPDIAIRAARLAGIPLVVAGTGPLLKDLRREAARDTTFVERVSDEELRELYRRARALVFPGIEDFGMTIVEAMACGTPVVAYADGGATESVIPGVSGVLVEAQSPEAFAEAIRRLPNRWDRDACRRVALQFSREAFRKRITEILTSIEGQTSRQPLITLRH